MAPKSNSNKLCMNRDFGTNRTQCNRQPNSNSDGKIYYRNAFLNFLREFRQNHTELSVTEAARKAGEVWRCMSPEQKRPYVQMAEKAQRNTKKKSRYSTRKHGGHSHERRHRRHHHSRSHSRR